MSEQVATENSLAAAAQKFLEGTQENTSAQASPAPQQAVETVKPAGNPLDEILTKPEADEKIGGKPLHEHPRFKELVDQKNEFKKTAEEYKALVAEVKQEAESRTQLNNVFLEIYSNFESPAEALRQDAQLADALTKLHDAGDPQVLAALERVQSFIKTGKVDAPTRPQESQKSQTNASDERLSKLLTQQWTSAADSLLNSSAIRPELRGLIRDGALKAINVSEDPSQEKLVAAVKAFIGQNGWDSAFLTGSAAKTAPPTAKGGATPVSPSASSGSPISNKKLEEVTDPQEYRQILRERFLQLAENSN